MAAESGRLDIAELLLNAGAEVNQAATLENPYLPTTTGITALHFAALKGNIPMMELLLSHGANINAIKVQVKNPGVNHAPAGRFFKQSNQSGQETALDMARRQTSPEVEAFLISHGAESAQHHDRRCSIM
jgi:ankyrin repeat protein